jgi:hypothetical protein
VKVTRAVCAVYVAACLAALALAAIGAAGWMDVTQEPAAIADLLGMPWSLLVAGIADAGAVGKVVLVAAAMALNLAIIFSTGRWLATRRA